MGPSILVLLHYFWRNRVSYQELGGDYFDRRNVDRQRKPLIRQLDSLGMKVTVEEVKEAA